MNIVNLIGRLTRDPELNYTTTGKAVSGFNLAVNRAFSKDNEADFFNVVTWNKLAENVANYLSKGRMVGVVGRLQSRTYEDKEGQRKYVVEVIANEVQFLNWGNNGKNTNSAQQDKQNNRQEKNQLFQNDGLDLDQFEQIDDEEFVPF